MVDFGPLQLPYVPFDFCANALCPHYFSIQTVHSIPILISASYCSVSHLAYKFDDFFPPKGAVSPTGFVSLSWCTVVMLSELHSTKEHHFWQTCFSHPHNVTSPVLLQLKQD